MPEGRGGGGNSTGCTVGDAPQHGGHQVVHVDRLGERGLHPRAQAPLTFLRQRVGALPDDGEGATGSTDLPGRFEAVELRHLHVHQHQGEPRIERHRSNRLGPVGHRDHLGAFVGEQRLQDLPVDGVVFGDEQAQASEPGTPRAPGVGLWTRGRSARPQRHPELKPAALPEAARRGEPSAHQLREVPADRQAEPGAPETTRGGGICLLERLREALQVGRIDADSGVGDPEDQLVALRAREQRDLPGRGELDGVGEQVQEDLLQAELVPEHAGRQHPFADGEGESVAVDVCAHRAPHGVHEAAGIQRRRQDVHLTRFNL